MSDILQNIHASLDNSQNEIYIDVFFYLNYMDYDWLHVLMIKLVLYIKKTKKKVNYNQKNPNKPISKIITTLHQ